MAQKSSLSRRALLVSVTVKQFSGRKLDKRATETANTAHNADRSAGQYSKRLLPGSIELATIATLAGQIRTYTHAQTLPWLADGTRIISGKNYLPFQTEIRNLRDKFESAVRDFAVEYPRLQQEAKQKLGDLYIDDEYPDSIADRFSVTVDFLPMPDSGDFRVAVSEIEKREFEKKMRAVENRAMRDASQRLLDVIKTATDRLKDPNAVFRDSLIANISEIASLLPMLNISDDATLSALSAEASTLATSFNPETLRTNKRERESAAKALSDIESRMGAFMGAFKST